MALIVPMPPAYVARLRFVTTRGSLLSRIIRIGTAGTVSHVEAVIDFPGYIITSHLDGGVEREHLDYDADSTLQIFVDLPMTPDMYVTWLRFLNSRVGWHYDSPAIAGFVTHFNLHKPGELICSALQVDALRHCGWFAKPLAARYHQISPVVLLLMLQADPRSIVHPTETA
jgi:hypothetical protein